MYFWRTKQNQEIDFVEEKNGKIYGFEFKWKIPASTLGRKLKIRIPETFIKTYHAEAKIIDSNNFREFVTI